MIDCNWARQLSRYDCREVKSLHGEAALEIGTPFSLLDGTAIVLYVIPAPGDSLVISDNGDTLMHLSGIGVDVSHGARLNKLRDVVQPFGMTLTNQGDFRVLARAPQAAFSFAQAVSAMLAVSNWASGQINEKPELHDLAAEAEPFIVARNPNALLIRKKSVMGASNTMHEFAFQHGSDLIDVIPPKASRTGASLRKAGDVQNGPMGMDLHPLIIVDDRTDHDKAEHEIAILGSLTRAMPMSRLMRPLH
jgi:hypothetical protein